MAFPITTPADVQNTLAMRVKTLRLAQNLTQSACAARAGVSLGSYKRFEQTGQASLSLVIAVSFVLGAESGWDDVFTRPEPARLKDILETPKRQRAR